jgi:hypothetical protein
MPVAAMAERVRGIGTRLLLGAAATVRNDRPGLIDPGAEQPVPARSSRGPAPAVPPARRARWASGSVGTGQWQHFGVVAVGVELAVAGVERSVQCLGECEVASVVGGVIVAEFPDSVGEALQLIAAMVSRR